MTEEQAQEYREKLQNREYMKAAINGVAEKMALNGISVELPDTRLKINKTGEKRMAKNTLNALNDHLMETIEWLTDRDIKGDKLTEQIRRSEAITKVATQVINNANVILRAYVAAENSSSGKMKLPSMIEDRN